MQVDLREVLQDLEQQVVGTEVLNDLFKLVLLKNIAHIRRERIDVITQVLLEVVRVALQRLQGVLGAVEEGVAMVRAIPQHGKRRFVIGAVSIKGFEDGVLSYGEHRIEAS